ncbi:hypothetical protein KO465_00720 [Candidatus Micrarchaeota archaeon]|nr:hypothetical protein [Candidatus Micrarchaeota archaeon]
MRKGIIKVINTDVDKTLISDFGTTILINANKADPKEALTRIFDKGLMSPLQFEFFMLGMKKPIEFATDNLVNIAKVGEYGLYQCDSDFKLEKKDLVGIKSELLVGITEGDVVFASKAAVGHMNPEAIEWMRFVNSVSSKSILLSDGWDPIVQQIASFFKDQGITVDFALGNTPVFVNGVYEGELIQINKMEIAQEVYRGWGIQQNSFGVFNGSIMIDDSSANIPMMQMHRIGIAYAPTQAHREKFGEAGILAVNTFKEAIDYIENYENVEIRFG